jgi:tetratricopeptide (TPR) repeat protein
MLRSLIVCVLVLLPSLASAQDVSGDAEARMEFERGRVEYAAGHFDEAVRLLRHAYVLSPRYGLLYNIGQAELRAGHNALALEAFEGFLRQAPADEAQRSEVEERVRVLRGLSAAPVSPSEPASPAPWVVVGIGGAVLIAGGVLMGVAQSEASRVTGAPPESSWASLSSARDNAITFWGVGIALLGVGAVAAGVGIVWGTVGSNSRGPSAQLRLLPTGLSLEGSF